jgi:hypothetical protein
VHQQGGVKNVIDIVGGKLGSGYGVRANIHAPWVVYYPFRKYRSENIRLTAYSKDIASEIYALWGVNYPLEKSWL